LGRSLYRWLDRVAMTAGCGRHWQRGDPSRSPLISTTACLDEQTEILTASGWKGMGQILEGELIYALNSESQWVKVCFQQGGVWQSSPGVPSRVERPQKTPHKTADPATSPARSHRDTGL